MWTYELISLNGTGLRGLKRARERKCVIAMSRMSTAECTLDHTDPALENIAAGPCGLRVWQDGTPRFQGPITGLSWEAGDLKRSLKVSASSPYFRLTKRLAGKSATGAAYVNTDRAMIAKATIDILNAENETGIQTVTVASGSTVNYTIGPYKYAADEVKALADATDGFDWWEQPITGTPGKLVRFNAQAVLGSIRNDAGFEYGGGRRNVASLKMTEDWQFLANRAFHILDEGPAAQTNAVISAEDATSRNTHGLYETIAETQGLTILALRQSLVAEHVRVRKNPRRVIEFTPVSSDAQHPTRVPRFGTDYFLGDFVPARVLYGNVLQFEGLARVYGVTVTIDNEGKELVAPTLVDEEQSS